MLEYIRERKRSWIGVIVAGFAAFLMLGFGINAYQNFQTSGGIIQVDGHDVSQRDFDRKFQQIDRAYQQQFGTQYKAFRAMLNVGQRAIDSIIAEVLLQHYTEKLGLSASPKIIREQLESLPTFKQSGLTEYTYGQLLRAQNLSAEAFETMLASDITTNQLQKILEDLSTPTAEEQRRAFIQQQTKVEIRSLAFDAKDYESKVAAPDDAKLKEYFEKNADRYRSVKKAEYSFVRFKPADQENQVQVSESDIKDYYESRSSDYLEPTKYNLRQIVFITDTKATPDPLESLVMGKDAKVDKNDIAKKKRELAKKVLDRLDAGEKFADIAKNTSEDMTTGANGGDLGWVKADDLEKPARAKIEELKAGQTTDIIDTGKALKIYHLEAVEEAKQKPLNDVKAEIESNVRRLAAPEYSKIAAENFYKEWSEERRKSKISLADFAKQKSLQVSQTDRPLAPQENPAGITAGLTMRVMSVDQTQTDLIALGNEDYVVEVTKIHEPALPELATVKEELKKSYVEDESKRLAKEAAESALKSAKGEKAASGTESGQPVARKTLSEIAQSLGKEVKTLPPWTKDTTTGDPLFSQPNAGEAIAKLSDSNPVPSEVLGAGSTLYVIELARRIAPEEKEVTDAEPTLREKEKTQQKSRLLETLQLTLKATADIWVNPKLLDHIKQNLSA